MSIAKSDERPYTHEMVIVHRVFRQEYVDGPHHHHSLEDELIRPLLTVAEWDLVGTRGLERIPKNKLMLASGAILEDATEQERDLPAG